MCMIMIMLMYVEFIWYIGPLVPSYRTRKTLPVVDYVIGSAHLLPTVNEFNILDVDPMFADIVQYNWAYSNRW